MENYKFAESVSESTMVFAKKLLNEGSKIFDIAEKIEGKIIDSDARPAFPLNISINENAAHYTPDIGDDTILKLGDIVKVDLGVQKNGYIWDSAFTICIGENTHKLIEASEKGLEEALKMIKPGTKVCDISDVVENTVKEFGLNPIYNLCGHGLEQFNQHASPTIPNGKNTIKDELAEGQAIAMEVFVTDGVGLVKESSPTLIYKYLREKPVRLWEGRIILKKAKEEFQGLPFTKRWLMKVATPLKIDMSLKQLMDAGALIGYPVLKEESNGKVAQTEQTVIVK